MTFLKYFSVLQSTYDSFSVTLDGIVELFSTEKAISLVFQLRGTHGQGVVAGSRVLDVKFCLFCVCFSYQSEKKKINMQMLDSTHEHTDGNR